MAPTDDLSMLSALTLEWHRAVTESPPESFQAWALGRLGNRLPFDAAFWASGHYEGRTPVVHNFVVANRPREIIVDYAQISADDWLGATCAASPGTAHVANAMAEDPRTSARVAAYLKKWRITHALSSHAFDEISGLLTGIALWRDAAKGAFGPDCRRFFELAVPHLVECSAANRLHHLGGSLGVDHARGFGALADRHGTLQVAQPDFQRLLLAEWPSWRGPRLPEPLTAMLKAAGERHFVGRHSAFGASPSNDLFVLNARNRCVADSLSPREREIARLVVQGLSRKQIAAELGAAQSTVRNHLSSVFIKLGIQKQSQLAEKLH
jgi:DNA-binding CsgD family transcriptional regulator